MAAGCLLTDIFERTSNFMLVNQRDDDGDRCPLHWAAAKGSLRACHVLVKNGADLHALDVSGRTPYDLAKEMRHEETAEFLKSMENPTTRAQLKLTRQNS